MVTRLATPLAAALILASCATTSTPRLPASQEAFFDALSSHCGNAYEGRMVSQDERDDAWQGRQMVAHFAECDERRVAIAFHMRTNTGWDRSRTWLVTRTADGLRLKHDHRERPGTMDEVTNYGGDTLNAGTARVQDFPADAYSVQLFERLRMPASTTNVWRLEVDDADTRRAKLAYQLTRRDDPTRLFRVEFDADDPVDTPPPAWGWGEDGGAGGAI